MWIDQGGGFPPAPLRASHAHSANGPNIGASSASNAAYTGANMGVNMGANAYTSAHAGAYTGANANANANANATNTGVGTVSLAHAARGIDNSLTLAMSTMLANLQPLPAARAAPPAAAPAGAAGGAASGGGAGGAGGAGVVGASPRPLVPAAAPSTAPTPRPAPAPSAAAAAPPANTPAHAPAPAPAPAPIAPIAPRADSITDLLPAPSAASITVGYATDVEGNLDYWHRYIALSQVLLRSSPAAAGAGAGATTTGAAGGGGGAEAEPGAAGGGAGGATSLPPLQLRDHCHFVYGGDVCDRGSGDIRICQDLLSLKRRYPDRVHLIVGNRDINKVRVRAYVRVFFISSPPSLFLTHIHPYPTPAPHTPIPQTRASPRAPQMRLNTELLSAYCARPCEVRV